MKLWHKRIKDSRQGVTVGGTSFSVGPDGEMEVPDQVGRRLLQLFPNEYTTTAPAKPRRVKQEADE